MSLDFASAATIKVAGTTVINSDASGRMLKPTHPVFSVYSANATVAAADIIFGAVLVNTGSYYNATNGRFTAPVAGTYYFAFHCLQNHANTGEFRHAIYKNGAGYGGLRFIHHKTAAAWVSSIAFGCMYMAANDYATVRYESGSGAMYTDANYNAFSGYLVG